MAIRWIKNVVIEGKKSTLEVQMGDKFMGDKSYTRIGKELEKWFKPKAQDREGVLKEGLGILKTRLQGKPVLDPQNKPFNFMP